ncbi:sorting nexin-16, partial [Trifolium medium]|nr:sorting nexin-16 [Trifolium medium]
MPECSADHDKDLSFEADRQVDEVSDIKDLGSNKHKLSLKRIASTSVVGTQPHKVGLNASEFHAPEFKKNEGFRGKSSSDMVIKKEGQGVPKLRCRVMGAYFEKLGSTSFAVYSIAVTDGQEKT